MKEKDIDNCQKSVVQTKLQEQIEVSILFGNLDSKLLNYNSLVEENVGS